MVSWNGPGQPAILGKVTVDLTDTLVEIQRQRNLAGVRVTLTHVVAKAVAMAIGRVPQLNGRLVWGRFVANPDVSVSILAALDGGSDLARIKVQRADMRSLADIAGAVEAGLAALRTGADQRHSAGRGVVEALPAWLLRPVIRTIGFAASCLGISVKSAGLEPLPFGSCIISNVGIFGVEEAYIPLMTWSHVPVYICVGAVRKTPVHHAGRVEIRSVMTLTATIDHRYVDGAQAAVFGAEIKRLLEDVRPLMSTPSGTSGSRARRSGEVRQSGVDGTAPVAERALAALGVPGRAR